MLSILLTPILDKTRGEMVGLGVKLTEVSRLPRKSDCLPPETNQCPPLLSAELTQFWAAHPAEIPYKYIGIYMQNILA
jgi:hypothetical protein